MKIAAVVIWYYPDEKVIGNINSYISVVEKLFIIDNSESAEENIPLKWRSDSKIIYLHDGENKGIAARLNQAVLLAIQDGFEWLLTMDQDSYFEKSVAGQYLDCIDSLQNKDGVSVFGVNYAGKKEEGSFCEFREVTDLITSGSVLNLQAIKMVGDFDENLFIDEVDFDYCVRSVMKGYRNIFFKNVYLIHQLGESSAHRSFKTTALTYRSLHSPIRIYYIVRNYFYIRDKYQRRFPKQINLRKKILLNRLKNNLLYNPKRIDVVKNMIKGFRHYKQKQMGKYQDQ